MSTHIRVCKEAGLTRGVLVLVVVMAQLCAAGASASRAAVPRQAPALGPPQSSVTPAPLRAAQTSYSIELRQPATHLYSATDNVEVKISTNRPGGGIENDISAQSQNVPQGTTNLSLGRVPAPGVYFTRYRVGTESFVNSFLVLPAGNNRFTVEIIAEPVVAVPVNPTTVTATEKFFRNLTGARLRDAAAAVAPAWFAQNGQNFVVLVAKGIVLTYSGIGFIAIMAQRGLAKEIFALSLDFVAAALARAADDLHAAQLLSAQERNLVKQALTVINGAAQTGLADAGFQRIVTLGQAATEFVLGQDSDAQVGAKVAGDSLKKYHVFIKLNPVRP